MPIRRRTFAISATAAYVVLAAAWIWLGDLLVGYAATSVAESQRYQSVKGGVFVALSGGFVYWLAHRARQQWVSTRAELLASRHDLETAVRVAGVGYWTVVPDSGSVSLSIETYGIYGLDPAKPVPSVDEVLELIHPDDRASFEAARDAFRRGDAEVFAATCRIIRPDGEIRWVEMRGEMVAAGDGNARVMGTVQDLTDLHTARERVTAFASHLEVAREEERKRLAMDIHDDIGAGLAGVRISLALLERGLTDPADLQSQVRTVGRELEDVISRIRHLAGDLRPAELDELGLGAALEGLAREWRKRCGWQLEVAVPQEDPFAPVAPERGIHVYRIVQEAFTNVARHSGASRVLLLVELSGGELRLVVEDHGRGMPQLRSNGASFGILNMQQRATMLGGTLIVAPAEGGGTRVELRMPQEGVLAHSA